MSIERTGVLLIQSQYEIPIPIDQEVTKMLNQDMKYCKAKKDMIEAIHAFNELSVQQQRTLVNELLGCAMASQMIQMMNSFR